MVITRQLINKNIIYTDYDPHWKKFTTYSYNDLSKLVDAYKNLFLKNGFKKGTSIVIGNRADIVQLALVLACSELGITIVIVNNPFPANKTAQDYKPGFINSKYKLMLPVDLFVINNKEHTDKFEVFKDTCRFTLLLNDIPLDYTPNNIVLADEETIFLKCTSSGTTGTPKVITHTHKFLFSLIKRNSEQFFGTMGMMTNLAHGSSPAVYYIPGLISQNVTQYINFPNMAVTEISDAVNNSDYNLDHLLVPYTLLIDEFFASNKHLENCNIHTLGLIRQSWLKEVNNKRVKDIISIFGTNETSGPLFLNKASYINFKENVYKKIDDFYNISVEDSVLAVDIPIYNKHILTGDRFSIYENNFVHLGRSNLYRINDLELDFDLYSKEIEKIINAQLVIDSIKDSIYLAIWDNNVDESQVQKAYQIVSDKSNGLHKVGKRATLQQTDFLNGIKLDMELLREYFRNL